MDFPLKLTYDLVGSGWSSCIVEAGDTKVELSASYLSDALGNLVLFAHALASGFHSASVGFDEEPGEFRWVGERLGPRLVRVRILEFKELWGYRPSSEGKLLLSVELHPAALAEAVAVAADDVLHQHGLQGYKEKWGEHPFPQRELELLKTSIDAWRADA